MARYTKADGRREHARASTSATTPATKQRPSHNDPVGAATFLSAPQRLATALQLGACVPPPLEVLCVHVPNPRVVGHLPTSRAPQALRRAQPKRPVSWERRPLLPPLHASPRLALVESAFRLIRKTGHAKIRHSKGFRPAMQRTDIQRVLDRPSGNGDAQARAAPARARGAGAGLLLSTREGTRRVRLVRGDGRDLSG